MVRMDITPYVDSLQRDLAAAADAAGAEARDAAQRMAYALDPSLRLVLMEALSQAAAEITAELPSGSVDVRLKGRELEFVVDHAAVPTPPAPPAPPAPTGEPEESEDGSVVRITLRLPEALKNRAEELAAAAGQSLNTWLVAAARRAARQPGVQVDVDLSSITSQLFDGGFPLSGGRGPRRMTGWV